MGLVFTAALVLLVVDADIPEAFLDADAALVDCTVVEVEALPAVVFTALDAVEADAFAAAVVAWAVLLAAAADDLTAALVVAADALSALLTAGVLTLAAELNLALATAPRRTWAYEWLTMPNEAITMVAMIVLFIITDLLVKNWACALSIVYPPSQQFVTPLVTDFL